MRLVLSPIAGVSGFLDSLNNFAESSLGKGVLTLAGTAAGMGLQKAIGGTPQAQSQNLANIAGNPYASYFAPQPMANTVPISVPAPVAEKKTDYMPLAVGLVAVAAAFVLSSRK